MLLCHLAQLGHACHGSVLVENLDEGSRGLQSCHAGKVNGGLSMSGALEHALVLGIERIDVAGPAEVGGLARGVGQSAYGGGAVVGAHAGGASVQKVNSHGERRAQHAGVLLYLMRQFQLPGTAHGDGSTEYAASVAQHEVHLFGCYHLGRGDEVAFVLAVFVIYHNDKLALLEVLKSLLDGAQCHIVIHIVAC